jgi:phosphatidylglycerophosphate synthase
MLEEKREVFEKITEKTNKYFSLIKISPNIFTLSALIFAIFSFIFLVKKNLILASLFFILAITLDWIDGKIARATKKITKVGAYLDTIIDRYVEGVVLLGFLFLSLPSFLLPSSVWIFLALFGSFQTTYSKAASKEKGLKYKKIKFNLAGRAERVILIALSMILGIFNLYLTTYLIFILAIISNISALQRIYFIIKKYF